MTMFDPSNAGGRPISSYHGLRGLRSSAPSPWQPAPCASGQPCAISRTARRPRTVRWSGLPHRLAHVGKSLRRPPRPAGVRFHRLPRFPRTLPSQLHPALDRRRTWAHTGALRTDGPGHREGRRPQGGPGSVRSGLLRPAPLPGDRGTRSWHLRGDHALQPGQRGEARGLERPPLPPDQQRPGRSTPIPTATARAPRPTICRSPGSPPIRRRTCERSSIRSTTWTTCSMRSATRAT